MADEGKPDDTEPTPERQAELRAAYDKNVAEGKAPYEGAAIHTRGELSWVMRERDWLGAIGESIPTDFRGAILRGANLSSVVLVGVNLPNADLNAADLLNADLYRANLSGTDLFGANLTGANLLGANLSVANLFGANLTGAKLFRANLSGADLSAATFSGADLRGARMSVETTLSGATFAPGTRLADVIWNSVPLAWMEWEPLSIVGDETQARTSTDTTGEQKSASTRREEYEGAVRAYRLLAVTLRSQGLYEYADRYAYRAQLMQRVVLRRQRHCLRWLGSLFLWLIAGYGFRPLRSVLTYVLVVASFAALYFGLGGAHGHALSWNESLIVSLTAFHGRGFFATAFQPGDPQAAVAAIEAVFGLLIEITFIATFTNRSFAR